MSYDGINLIIINESATYLPGFVDNPILLITNSAQINLDKVITELSPQLIIADGSNYRNVVDRWQQTCKERRISFLNTYEQGAIDLTHH